MEDIANVLGTFLGLAIAGLIAFFVSRDADKRGMNGTAWGAGVFLLTIVVVPIYFMMRKPLLEQTAEPYGNRQSPSVFCTACRKYHDARLAFCPHCGAQQT